jgi:hypothetical protein
MKITGNGNKAMRRLRDAEGQVADVATGLARAEAEVERWRPAGSEAQRAVDEADMPT